MHSDEILPSAHEEEAVNTEYVGDDAPEPAPKRVWMNGVSAALHNDIGGNNVSRGRGRGRRRGRERNNVRAVK